MTSTIQLGEKFSYLCLPGVYVDQDEFWQNGGELLIRRDGDIELWATLEYPVVQLEEHWREQLGVMRSDRITSAALYLVAKRTGHVNAVDVLDEQNIELDGILLDVYRSLIAIWPIETSDYADFVVGAGREAESSTNRGFTPYARVYQIPGTQPVEINGDALTLVASFMDAAKVINTVDFPRLNKAIRSFWLASHSRFFDERIHQVARCIEGLILPKQAHTKTQFRTRTELFIGNQNQKLTGNIYNLRSAIEHLNNPLEALEEVAAGDKYLYIYKAAVMAEGIARYCLTRILSDPEIMTHFKSDAAIQNFWNLEQHEREEIWGDQYDLQDSLNGFEPVEEVLKEFERIF